mmetsp:Transcript_12629/g.28794  ORF Transcript_12629/g.28794 Transcript_12629/m.28794 type:complete len:110 (-) Transcript_12629:319-648(-)
MLEVAAYQFLVRKRRPAFGRERLSTGNVGFGSGNVVETSRDAGAARELAERETQLLECHRQLLVLDPIGFVGCGGVSVPAVPPSPSVFILRGGAGPAPGRGVSAGFRRC